MSANWCGKSTPVAYSVSMPTSKPNITQRPLLISFLGVHPKTWAFPRRASFFWSMKYWRISFARMRWYSTVTPPMGTPLGAAEADASPKSFFCSGSARLTSGFFSSWLSAAARMTTAFLARGAAEEQLGARLRDCMDIPVIPWTWELLGRPPTCMPTRYAPLGAASMKEVLHMDTRVKGVVHSRPALVCSTSRSTNLPAQPLTATTTSPGASCSAFHPSLLAVPAVAAVDSSSTAMAPAGPSSSRSPATCSVESVWFRTSTPMLTAREAKGRDTEPGMCTAPKKVTTLPPYASCACAQ
ncbi:hypothetical protein TSOC_000312 [Tetrabaena socialis]|uniref:Uncharacterized protein n=1 Tax=Tetrabaena socialis TaxID=47790 RepID=A0A2J8AJM9_9CHLO|nr:hypothetical protein TSOC_000312 [Tetrabaena socialis]|eukprot:PNH12732.1 hypothetical protein TSOC_000312 [Tetrabaena socialis]